MKNILIILLSLAFLPTVVQAQCGKLDSLYRVLRVAKADSDKINTLNALVEELIIFGKEGQASFYASQALKMAKEAEYDKGIADALSHIGLMSSKDVRQMQKTIEDYESALEIYEDLGNQEKAAQMHEVIAYYHFKAASMEDYKTAITHFNKAIKLREAQKQIKETSDNYEMLGEIYGLLKKDDEALEAFLKAQKLKQSIDEDDDMRNAHILAKYKRVRTLERNLENSATFKLMMVVATAFAILIVVMFVMIIQRNKAVNELKQFKATKA